MLDKAIAITEEIARRTDEVILCFKRFTICTIYSRRTYFRKDN